MQTIYIDISNKMVLPKIYAKQGDVGRKFEVVFTDSGVPYNIPLNALFSVWFSGASGEGNYTHIGDVSAFTITNNHVVVEIIAEMLKNKGDGVLCLVLSNESKQIGTWNIPYICEEVPGFESEAVKEYYTAFSALVEQLKTPDTTFSKAGYPADAKATGDITVNNKRLRDNPMLTASDVGAAPAGYGLGGAAVYKKDLNTVINNGYYRWDTTAVNAPFHAANGGGSMFVLQRNENYAHQLGFDDTESNLMALNSLKGGGWSGWEYINPKLVVGIEYRTIFRWNGKAVWAKVINIGSFPSGETNVAHNISGIDIPLLCLLTDGGSVLNQYRTIDKVWFDKSNVSVITNAATFSTATVYATLVYTKD